MKTPIVLALAVTVASAAFAKSPAPAAAKKAPTDLTCPVMTKNKVNIAKATKAKMYADYKGNRYFFCCPGCPEAFKKNPAKYAKAPHIPIPKK